MGVVYWALHIFGHQRSKGSCWCRLCYGYAHDWHQCRCARCGSQKPQNDPAHTWRGCTCEVCQLVKQLDDPAHDWDRCICRLCSTERAIAAGGHDWDQDTGRCKTCTQQCGHQSLAKVLNPKGNDTGPYSGICSICSGNFCTACGGRRRRKCGLCAGSGGLPSQTCSACGGSGRESVPCPKCDGTGLCRGSSWYISIAGGHVFIARCNYSSPGDFVAGPFEKSDEAVGRYREMGEPSYKKLAKGP